MEATLAPPVGELGQIFLDAAALIEEYGWVQEMAGDFDHGFCAVGAITQASEATVPALLWDTATAYHRSLFNRLIFYNDKSGRTREEVVAYLRDLALKV